MTSQSELPIEEIKSEIEDEESALPNYKIISYPADYTLEVIHTLLKKGDIEIPKFQRKYVWKPFQSIRLIESFLAGLPVPPIFIYTDPDTQRSKVIDGQQRIRSVYYFIEGDFPEDSRGKKNTFRLNTLNKNSKWYNKTFSELSESDQRMFMNRPLRAFVIEQLDPKDDTSIMYIFERLNTGGTLLTNQEIRNSVYEGKFNRFLHDLNKYPVWKQLIDKKIEDPRLKDIELILRFIALQNNYNKYEKPLKEFLSKFMRDHKKGDDKFLIPTKLIFEKTCDAISANLKPKPFNFTKSINPALFDSIMVAFSKHLDDIPSDIKERYTILINTQQFKDDCRDATTDVNVLKRRFEKAEEILFS
jgi:uncharacterized protein with ParB-like and HNH nuclease domain